MQNCCSVDQLTCWERKCITWAIAGVTQLNLFGEWPLRNYCLQFISTHIHQASARPVQGTLRAMQMSQIQSLLVRTALANAGHTCAELPPSPRQASLITDSALFCSVRSHRAFPIAQCSGGFHSAIHAICHLGSRGLSPQGRGTRNEKGGACNQLTCDRDECPGGDRKKKLAPVLREVTP